MTDNGAAGAACGEVKEKKARPPPPPPPPALATASLLVRGAAARVLGLRPGACGAELQSLWVKEPGYAKVTLSLEGCARSPFPKDEAHRALIDAIEEVTKELVCADAPISVFEMDRAAAEVRYKGAMHDANSASGEVLRLAYVPGAVLTTVPANWSLCATAGACGAVAFQKDTEPGSKKKPDTMILYKGKQKQVTIRFSVTRPDAAGAKPAGGSPPSPEAVEELDSGRVRVHVPGVDGPPAAAAGVAAAEKVRDTFAARALAAAGPGTAPRFPYPPKDAAPGAPAVIYWEWFGRALGKRVHESAVAAGCSKADVLRDPTASGLCQTCSKVFGRPLSEAEATHLGHAPVAAEWLGAILKGFDFPASQAAPSASGAKAAKEEEEMVVNSFEVSGKIDYNKLVEQFGSTLITPELLERLERLTVGHGNVPEMHPWLRRGIFYSHRDLDQICRCVEQKKPFYLYTGRGPSSLAMHLGHLIPFMMTKWLQDAFNVPLVIQMTDDEKFLWKGQWDPKDGDNLMMYRHFTTENVKDIIAVGFDKKKTFIFSDLDYFGHMYPNIVRFWKAVTYNTARSCFGFQGDSNIGQSAFPAVQAAPSFPSTFQVPLGGQENMCCLIPCAIDQDPYFRLTREVAHKLVPKSHPLQGKPALLHAKFFPPLQGVTGKMSASDTSSAIYLTDSPDEIKNKINKYAFSGGQATAKEQRERGADLEVDVSYHWLRFFLKDDEELEKIGREYGSGQGDYWNTGSVKKRLIDELQKMVAEHQARRDKITDAEVAEWMQVRRLEF